MIIASIPTPCTAQFVVIYLFRPIKSLRPILELRELPLPRGPPVIRARGVPRAPSTTSPCRSMSISNCFLMKRDVDRFRGVSVRDYCFCRRFNRDQHVQTGGVNGRNNRWALRGCMVECGHWLIYYRSADQSLIEALLTTRNTKTGNPN